MEPFQKKLKLREDDQKALPHRPIFSSKKAPLHKLLNAKLSKKKKAEIISKFDEVVQTVQNLKRKATFLLKMMFLHILNSQGEYELWPRSEETLQCLIHTAFRLVSAPTTQGRPLNPFGQLLLDFWQPFYDHDFRDLFHPDDRAAIDAKHLAGILIHEEAKYSQNLRTQIIKNLQKYVRQFINLRFKPQVDELDKAQLSDSEKARLKRELRKELNLVKNDFFTPLHSKLKCHEKYWSFIDEYKPKIIKTSCFSHDQFLYDLKENTFRYLPAFAFIVHELGMRYAKYHQLCPLASSCVPSYVNFDTGAMTELFGHIVEETRTEHMEIDSSDEFPLIWRTIFDVQNNGFTRKGYVFDHTISSDGVGTSIVMRQSGLSRFAASRAAWRAAHLPEEKELNRVRYINELSAAEVKTLNLGDLNDKKNSDCVVGVDVGKDNILFMSNDTKKFRYTHLQRRHQMHSHKFTKLMDDKKKLIRDPANIHTIKEWEATLSRTNKYTTSYEGFSAYINAHSAYYVNVHQFYAAPDSRRIRFNQKINTQRSEDVMCQNIKKTFGDPKRLIIGIGNYSSGSYHLPHHDPTPGKRFRNVLRRHGFRIFLIDEHRTSCVCYRCDQAVTTYQTRISKKPQTKGQQIICHHLLGCYSDQGCRRRWNRDLLGSLNIRRIALCHLKGEERPELFRRGHHQDPGPAADGISERISLNQ